MTGMTEPLTFAAWFDAHYRRVDETKSAALARFGGEHSISSPTLFYAHHGARVAPDVALRLEAIAGGALRAGDLTIGPSRADVKASMADERGAA